MSVVLSLRILLQSTRRQHYIEHNLWSTIFRAFQVPRGAQFYIATKRGHNQTMFGLDELHQFSNLGGGRWGDRFEAQSQVLISICGDLRDRWLPQTLPEVTKALARLASRLSIDTCLVSVEDDCGQKFLFNNPKWLRDMPMSDWMLRHGIARDWNDEE